MERCGYSTDLSDAQWALIEPHLPPPRRGGRRRAVNLRAVINAIFYLLRSGCQWRLLPRDFPPWGTVWWYCAPMVPARGLDSDPPRSLSPCSREEGLAARAQRRDHGRRSVCAKRGVPKTTEKGAFAASMATSE